jgi:hypothetical protein
MALIKRTTKGSPLTFAEGDANLVYLEALALSGSGGMGGATTGSNTFVGNQTITGSLTVTQGITGSLLGTASFATTASFALNVTPIDTSSFATTGSNIFVGNQIISGSGINTILQVHGANAEPWAFGIYNDAYNPTQSVLAGFVDNTGEANIGTEVDKPLYIYTNANYNVPTLTISSSGVTVNGNQIIRNGTLRLSPGYQLVWTGSEVLNDWNYAPMFNASALGNGFLFSPQGVFATPPNQVFINMSGSLGVGKFPTASLDVSGSVSISNGITSTGSILGNVTALTIASNTASLDLTSGSFYTLQLVSNTNTFINPTNIRAGQTVSILVSTTGSATVSFPAIVDQPSGSAYVPTTTTGKDVLTFISFDTTNLYLASVKNLV